MTGMVTITREQVEANAARNCARMPQKINLRHKAIIEAGGGIYEPGLALDTLVMFDSPETGSTLCLPENLLTADNVRAKIRKSNRDFGVSI